MPCQPESTYTGDLSRASPITFISLIAYGIESDASVLLAKTGTELFKESVEFSVMALGVTCCLAYKSLFLTARAVLEPRFIQEPSTEQQLAFDIASALAMTAIALIFSGVFDKGQVIKVN